MAMNDDGGSNAARAQLARNEAYRKMSLALLVMLVTTGFGLHARWLFSADSFADAVDQTRAWLDDLSGPRLSAHLLIFGPFIGLLLLITALLVRHGLPKVWQSARRSALLGVLLGACVLAAALLTSGKLKGFTELQWLFFVPVVPPILLGYQALLVWRQRPRSLGRFSLGVSAGALKALKREGAVDRFQLTYQQLVRAFGGNAAASRDAVSDDGSPRQPAAEAAGGAYEPAYFVTNFAVPGLLLLFVGFGAMSIALVTPAWANEFAERGLKWGVAGAFVYVLIEFGGRFFRNDLTIGAATWAIVTLIVGPTLAVILSIAWRMEPGNSPWQTGAVLFFAGLAPRRVVTIVESVALQFLKTPNETAAAHRVMPLTTLRGITPEIAIRLREENINDLGALAYADAIRLVQSLPYDLRQVVDWIDQAQLALVLPKHYETLRERGVTGAIDLAWRWVRASVEEIDGEAVLQPASTPPESFKTLVELESDAALVYETAAQLFYEEQVCLLWVMYNCFSTTTGGFDLRVDLPAAEGDGAARSGSSQPPTTSAPRLRTVSVEEQVGDDIAK